jgi:hypothetical protein
MDDYQNALNQVKKLQKWFLEKWFSWKIAVTKIKKSK